MQLEECRCSRPMSRAWSDHGDEQTVVVKLRGATYVLRRPRGRTSCPRQQLDLLQMALVIATNHRPPTTESQWLALQGHLKKTFLNVPWGSRLQNMKKAAKVQLEKWGKLGLCADWEAYVVNNTNDRRAAPKREEDEEEEEEEEKEAAEKGRRKRKAKELDLEEYMDDRYGELKKRLDRLEEKRRRVLKKYNQSLEFQERGVGWKETKLTQEEATLRVAKRCRTSSAATRRPC